MRSRVSEIKRGQKTALFLREISSLIHALAQDEPAVAKVYVTRVKLSADYKICFVYFAAYQDKSDFDDALETLKLYKSSIRSALSKKVSGKYIADLVFLYDDKKEKERRITQLLDKVMHEEEQSNIDDENQE